MDHDEVQKVGELVQAVNRVLSLWDNDCIGTNPKWIFAGYEAIEQIQDMRRSNGVVEDLCRNVSTNP